MKRTHFTESRSRWAGRNKTRSLQSVLDHHCDPAKERPATCGAISRPTGPVPITPVDELQRLYTALGVVGSENNPRTFKLLESGTRKIAQKVIEEAGEVVIEAVRHHANGVVRESADLLYHLVVLRRRAGIEPASVWQEMKTRADAFGIAEKPHKSSGDTTPHSKPRASNRSQ
jgi:phosphoribosyl-ATP pyrophosphohydrolase